MGESRWYFGKEGGSKPRVVDIVKTQTGRSLLNATDSPGKYEECSESSHKLWFINEEGSSELQSTKMDGSKRYKVYGPKNESGRSLHKCEWFSLDKSEKDQEQINLKPFRIMVHQN